MPARASVSAGRDGRTTWERSRPASTVRSQSVGLADPRLPDEQGHLEPTFMPQKSCPGRAPTRVRGRSVRYTPARDVRTLKMVHDQAPEGRHRRQARRPLHQGRPGDLRGRPAGRRRPRRELPVAAGDREGPLGEHARRQHQADDRQGDRRRRGRAVRGDRLRGLRAGRRGGPRRGPDRQPQPDRGRGPLDVRQGRRPARRIRRGRLAVRAARPDHRPARRRDADEVALAAIDAGADDVDTEATRPIEIYTEPADLEAVRKALEERRRRRSSRPSRR